MPDKKQGCSHGFENTLFIKESNLGLENYRIIWYKSEYQNGWSEKEG